MQSELASHIGLNGNQFCRVCRVQTTLPVEDDDDIGLNGTRSRANSAASSDIISSASTLARKQAKNTRAEPTMSDYVDRARLFLEVSVVSC